MICAHHFHKDDFLNKSKKDRLKKNVVPTIFASSQNNESDFTEENQASQFEPIDECEQLNGLKVRCNKPRSKDHKTNQLNKIDRINCYIISTIKKKDK